MSIGIDLDKAGVNYMLTVDRHIKSAIKKVPGVLLTPHDLELNPIQTLYLVKNKGTKEFVLISEQRTTDTNTPMASLYSYINDYYPERLKQFPWTVSIMVPDFNNPIITKEFYEIMKERDVK